MRAVGLLGVIGAVVGWGFASDAAHLCLSQTAALAHELRPAIVSAEIHKSGDLDLRIALNLEALVADIGPEHENTESSDKAEIYDRLRRLPAEALTSAFAPLQSEFVEAMALSFDGAKVPLELTRVEVPQVGDPALARISTLYLSGAARPGAQTMTWSGGERLGENVLRITRGGEAKPFFSTLLGAGGTSEAIPLNGAISSNPFASAVKYTVLGFEHILPKGLDHILFIIALFLLSPHIRPLLWQVTGFTLAHSVTLALGIYGLVSIPAAIVEPLIAASIAFVAIENLFTDRLRRWRPATVFAFGLLHGLGFAGVLAEIGLPRDQFLTALVGFNLGVELGQLAVIAACFLGVGLWFRHRSWYRPAITMPASVAIAMVASVWVLERSALV